MTPVPHGARRRLRVAAVGLGRVTTHCHLPAALAAAIARVLGSGLGEDASGAADEFDRGCLLIIGRKP